MTVTDEQIVTALDKAKAACAAAKNHGPEELAHGDLLRIASVQAGIAQAEALTSIADTFAALVKSMHGDYPPMVTVKPL